MLAPATLASWLSLAGFHGDLGKISGKKWIGVRSEDGGPSGWTFSYIFRKTRTETDKGYG